MYMYIMTECRYIMAVKTNQDNNTVVSKLGQNNVNNPKNVNR